MMSGSAKARERMTIRPILMMTINYKRGLVFISGRWRALVRGFKGSANSQSYIPQETAESKEKDESTESKYASIYVIKF